MIISFIAGIILVFLCGMDLQRILTERDNTPAYVYISFAFTAIAGIFNLVAYVGYVAGKIL